MVAQRVICPDSQECVLRYALERRAAASPDRLFATFASGDAEWTFAATLAQVKEAARVLRHCGVGRGEHVLSWQPNGPGAIITWLALNYLGAVYVPLNTAFRGRILEHAIGLSDASLMVAHPDLLPRLDGLQVGALRTILSETAALDLPGVTVARASELRAAAESVSLDLVDEIRPWETCAIIYTSGTTGPSKAVLSSYLQFHASLGASVVPLTVDERTLVHSPLFHVTGLVAIYRSLVTGASVAVLERFRTETFWQDVQTTGATNAVIMGSIAAFLLKQPPSEAEKATPLKTLCISPLTADGRALAERIGARFFTVFSMSETSRPLISELDPAKNGSCGRPRPGVQARIVDPNDFEVEPGQVGELVIRTDEPWAMLSGYHKNPEATAAAWRNGWFHTGDAFRTDADGDYFFVDRLKDAIRRRGENISSFEVEVEVAAHPAVQDCAAIAVRSDLSEDELMVVIEPRRGAAIDPSELLAFLRPRMPHYMVPRYVRLLPVLPRTPTLRVQKHLLRQDGVTPDTWDRETAGIVISADRIGRTDASRS